MVRLRVGRCDAETEIYPASRKITSYGGRLRASTGTTLSESLHVVSGETQRGVRKQACNSSCTLYTSAVFYVKSKVTCAKNVCRRCYLANVLECSFPMYEYEGAN